MQSHTNTSDGIMPLQTQKWLTLAVAVLSLYVAASSRALVAAETIKDDVLGFTLTLPEGFKRDDVLLGLFPDAKHAFVLESGDEDSLDIMSEPSDENRAALGFG